MTSEQTDMLWRIIDSCRLALEAADKIERLREALTEIEKTGSGVSRECEALADIARRALEVDR